MVIWQEEEIGATVAEARSRWGGAARWLQHDAASGEDTYEAFLAAGLDGDPLTRRRSGRRRRIRCSMLYTGAFGGTPNGALISHRAIISQSLMMAMVQRVTGETVYLNSGPMFHMATLMTTFATFQMGGTNVLARRVDAEELCRIIETEHCNYGFVMGPTAEQILEVNADQPLRPEQASAPSGGAPPGTR